MANNQYELRIKIEGTGGGNSLIAGQDGAGVETTNTPIAEKQDVSASLAGFVATRVVKPFLQSMISITTSNVSLLTGSSGLQEKVDFAMKSINEANNILSSTMAGATIGGPIGAVVGLTVGVASTGIGYLQNYIQLGLEKMVEDRQLNYTQNRLGPTFNSSRRG